MASKWSPVLAWSAVVMATCAGVACAASYDEEPPVVPAPADAGANEGGGAADGGAVVTDAAPPDADFSCASVDADFCADFEEPATDAAVPFGFTSAFVSPGGALRRSTDTSASGEASLLAALAPSDAGENIAFLVRDLGAARQLVSTLEVELALFVPSYDLANSNVLTIGVGNTGSVASDYAIVLSLGRDEKGAPRAGLLEVATAPDGGRAGSLTFLDRVPPLDTWSRLRIEVGVSPPRVTLTVGGDVAVNKPLLGVPARRDVAVAVGLGAQDGETVGAARQVRHDDLVVRVR